MKVKKINQRMRRGVSLSLLGAALSLDAGAALAQHIGTCTYGPAYS